MIFISNLIICILGTFLSAMSGCGTGIIIIPIWILMGYSLHVSLAVLQITSILWCPLAAKNYLKGQALDYKLLGSMLFIGLLGTFVGASTITKLDQDSAGKFVGIIIILIAILINFFDHKKAHSSQSKFGNIIAAIFAFPLGVYEAAFGAGNAIISSFILMKTKALDLSTSLGYYYAIATFWCLSAAIIYLLSGFSDWSLLIAATIGSVIGAELGSKFGKAKGSAFLKKAVLIAGVALAIKLLMFT